MKMIHLLAPLRLACCSVLIAIAFAPRVKATNFDLSRDFSSSHNPAGVWSYGWKENLGGSLGLLTQPAQPSADNGVVVFGWVLADHALPAIYINPTAETAIIGGGQGVLPPGTVWFHPGWDNRSENFAVIRFTSPTNGNFEIQATASPVYSGSLSGDSDFHIIKNGTELFGVFLSPTSTGSFTGVVALAVGDTLDFAIGRGADPDEYGAALKLAATITATTAEPPPHTDPLIAWWPLDGGGHDGTFNGHQMTFLDEPEFVTGVSTQALRLHGTNYGQVLPPGSLDIGASEGLTLELWINPTDVASQQPLLEWDDAVSVVGLHFWISTGGPGSLFANLISRDGVAHHVSSAPGVVQANVFQHVALTYSQTSGVARLYANGAQVAESNVGSFVPETRTELYVGWRTPNYFFNGAMDEIKLHARELSGAEIAAIAATYSTPTNPPAVHGDFDLSRDFSSSDNPGGVWSYGWKETLDGALGLLTQPAQPSADNGVVVFGWVLTNQGLPAIYINPTAETAIIGGGQGVLPPGTVWFHPGWNNRPENFAAIRFTAPTNGNFEIEATASPVYSGSLSGDSDFHIVKNGTELFGAFLSPSSTGSFTGVVALAVGDTLDFVIGRGADPDEYGAALRIAATITPTTEEPPTPTDPLVAWWPLDGSGHDGTFNGHQMTFVGEPEFVTGVSTQALRLHGTNYGQVFPPGSLDIGPSEGLTLELWINPTDIASQQPLLEWDDAVSVAGLHFWISVVSGTAGGGPGSLFANLISRDGVAHHVSSAPGVVQANVFQHVALTYSQTSGVARLYANGEQVAESNVGSFVPETRTELYVGWRTPNYFFNGAMDEIKLHARELSGAEIAAIAASNSTPTNPPTDHADFDLSHDFGVEHNPAGAWSYGSLTALGGTFSLHTSVRTFSADNGVPIRGWERVIFGLPGVWKIIGESTAMSDGEHFTGPPGTVYFAPGSDDAPENFGAIRFTVPSGGDGQYRIQTAVQSLFDGARSRDADFHVVRNGQELFGAFLEPNATAAYSNIIQLTAGDTIDFAIGRGADGLTADTGLKIQATLTRIYGEPPACLPVPAGQVAWWALDGHTNDLVGDNSLTLLGEPFFGEGHVAQGLQLDGSDDTARAEASSNLDVGLGAGLTVEGWIQLFNPANLNPITEWNDDEGGIGVHLWTSVANSFGGGPGGLYANLIDTSGTSHQIITEPHILASNVFQHVALTYDSVSGLAALYLDGQQVAQTNLGSFKPQTAFPLYLGYRPSGPFSGFRFHGIMDEIGLYNRALSAAEVQAIAAVGADGKCKASPPTPHSGGFNLARDFSIESNPNGAWSYGWKETVGGAFANLPVPHLSTTGNPHVQVPSWQLTSSQTPAVYCNTSSVTVSFGGGAGEAAPGTVWFYPGENSRPENFGVVRFTAPTNGIYRIDASASPVYAGHPQGDTDFHVVVNNLAVSGQFLSPQGSAGYSSSVQLASGQTVDFVIGRGADGDSFGSGLKLSVLITPTNDVPLALTNPTLGSLAHFSMLPNSVFESAVHGDASGGFAIDASSDLVNWQTITNVGYVTGMIRFCDPEAATATRRFYRARLLAP